MTKEPIMIDGVDVSKCQYLHFAIEDSVIDYKEHPRCSIGEAFTNNACKNSNCYYKQLQRKEQELETICKAFDIEYAIDEETGSLIGRSNKLREKEQECERLNEENAEIRKYQYEQDFLQQQLDQLKAENERLKENLKDTQNKYSKLYQRYENKGWSKEYDNLKSELRIKKIENIKLRRYLHKIRDEELSHLDISWDEYETCARQADYSNIVTLVERALGEIDE